MNLSVKDAANLLAVSEKTIYRWIKRGVLAAYRVHEQYRFNRAELLEWATSQRINVAPEMLDEPEEPPPLMPSLAEALEAGGIHYRVEGDSRDAVLAQVVRHLALPETVDREYLTRLLIARERLASTGVGNGVAVPHVRNPSVLHVTQPLVALSFLEHPVDFHAIDGVPVHTLFCTISPTLRSHLTLLSHLGFALRHPQVKAVLAQQPSRTEILAAIRQLPWS
ncbi:MAG: PTS sugar transporter subunit IIA [Thermodesulfobacteriota bacterium]